MAEAHGPCRRVAGRGSRAPPGTVVPWAEALAEANRAAGQARELADPERNGQIAYVITELEQSRRSAKSRRPESRLTISY